MIDNCNFLNLLSQLSQSLDGLSKKLKFGGELEEVFISKGFAKSDIGMIIGFCQLVKPSMNQD